MDRTKKNTNLGKESSTKSGGTGSFLLEDGMSTKNNLTSLKLVSSELSKYID